MSPLNLLGIKGVFYGTHELNLSKKLAIYRVSCKICPLMNRKLCSFILINTLGLMGFLFLWNPTTPPHKLSFRQAVFSQLPGWREANAKKSLIAFRRSCEVFLKKDPNQSVGSEFVDLKAKDWLPACKASLSVNSRSNHAIKAFFEDWFIPVEFFDKHPVRGLFTGYYMPAIPGSLKKTSQYNVPLYDLPKNASKHYSRAEINQGALKNKAKVIAWIKSKIDRAFLEIEGSGVIQLPKGKQLVVSYSGENGAKYTSIAKILMDKGVLNRDNASEKRIRRYLKEHPQQIDTVLNKNKSFVFFSVMHEGEALGSQGVTLTPGYSLAIDRKWVPMGAPVWLNTSKPTETSQEDTAFQRLMIAQDTGGAIKGMVRGDVYWGAGEKATSMSAKMKNKGHYWLLMPQNAIERLSNKLI